MWGANHVRMGRSPIQSPSRTPAGLIQSEWSTFDYTVYTTIFRFLTHLSLCLSRCNGRVVIREGNATADTVCQPFTSNIQHQTTTKEPHVETGFPSTSPTMTTTDFVLDTAINFSRSIPLLHTTLSENKQGTVNDVFCSVGSMRETLRFYQDCNIAFFLCVLASCFCQHLLLC